MSYRRCWLGAVVLLASISPAVACGPDFPTQLLDDRAGTLKAFPANGFAYEATRLVPVSDAKLKPVESEYSWYDPDQAGAERSKAQAAVESQGLTELQAKTIGLMRAMASGDAAYSVGAALPEAVRLYAAGAVDFHAGDWPAAAGRFQAVLDLPETDRQARVVWAAYMIGEVALRTGQPASAQSAFARARRLVVDGAPDPLGLAVASLGEEAKFHLDRAKDVGNTAGTDAADRYKQEVAEAVRLYALQAATGSNGGVQSLRIIAHELLSDSVHLPLVIADQTTQRLLVAYALARIDNDNFPPTPTNIDPYAAFTQDRPDRNSPILPELMAAIEQSSIEHAAGADRLAALAYRTGRYDLAEKMAALAPGPLSDWVRAKLAVQKGDLPAAAALYSNASKAFPTVPVDGPLEFGNAILLKGEVGVLALGRGDYVAALDSLFTTGDVYWGDVAYIAERVLTADELKLFVDTRVPPPDVTKEQIDPRFNNLPGRYLGDPATRLRTLLARRLMREGRYREAQSYFPQRHWVQQINGKDYAVPVSYDGAKTLVEDPLPKLAADYAAAVHDSESAWLRVSRARALYRAAAIARRSGMEILGYEEAPDFAVMNGAFEGGYGPGPLKGPFITDDEKKRFADSTARPDKRFHYRYLAVDEASRAADLLPPRSQAFAAVLCNGSNWLIDRDPPTAQALYGRYVKDGPYVPWANRFARACPEPDFDGAATLKWRMAWWDMRHFAGRNRWSLIAAFAVLVLLIGGFVLRSRREAH